MWPRVVEVMLSLWLLISPFIFGHIAGPRFFWLHDMAVAFVIAALALFSYWPPLKRAHLLIFAVGLWLIGFAALAFPKPPPPAAQNEVVIGFFLLMLSILPTRATEPPEGWQKFVAPS